MHQQYNSARLFLITMWEGYWRSSKFIARQRVRSITGVGWASASSHQGLEENIKRWVGDEREVSDACDWGGNLHERW